MLPTAASSRSHRRLGKHPMDQQQVVNSYFPFAQRGSGPICPREDGIVTDSAPERNGFPFRWCTAKLYPPASYLIQNLPNLAVFHAESGEGIISSVFEREL